MQNEMDIKHFNIKNPAGFRYFRVLIFYDADRGGFGCPAMH